ncbi:dsDNA nuclease domain-containing protein [Neorhizobium tomejilense]|uniref:dsDNA nuclease domain-containing protein n=1 Tax=Neorhizobium tomejilense TaxID=2093828 RepID=UPI003F4FE832
MCSGDIQSQEVNVHARLNTTASGDPGDETERNFRYQHQYGVVLLAAVRRGTFNYIALYCEHHEDFLAECQSARNVDPLSACNLHPPVGDQRLACPALAGVAEGRPSAGV